MMIVRPAGAKGGGKIKRQKEQIVRVYVCIRICETARVG